MRRNQTKIDESTIVESYQLLGSARKVSKHLKISQIIVDKILSERKLLKRHKVDTVIEQQAIDLMTHSDITKKEMIALLGIGKSTFKRLCKRLSLKRQVKRKAPPARHSGPMYDTMINKWGKEIGELKYIEYKAKLSRASSGSNNPMFGKSTPQGAGNGWKGWYKGHYFRSLREASFMIRMDEENIRWKTGETIRISYVGKNGEQRTYRPDFVLNDNQIVEIKPQKLKQSISVRTKAEAAQEYVKNNGMTYIMIDEPIMSGRIGYNFAIGNIRFQGDYAKRFYRTALNQYRKQQVA